MHSSIIAWLERRILFEDWADEMKSPSLWPTAFIKETPANLSKGDCNVRSNPFQDLCGDLIIPGGSRTIQLSEDL